MKIDPRNTELLDDKSVEILRQMSGEQRMIIASQMFDTVVSLIRANIEANHPDWTEEQIRKEIIKRLGNGPD